MTQLINDQGFVADDFATPYAPFDAAEGVEAGATALDVPSDVQPETIPVDGAWLYHRAPTAVAWLHRAAARTWACDCRPIRHGAPVGL